MLIEIRCVHFREGALRFRPGLNVILGDAEAKNSIGKSTALMLVDFVHGGNSFFEHDAGVINAVGEHSYDFTFSFIGRSFKYSRSTETPGEVHICDDNYGRISTIDLNEFKDSLKNFYGLSTHLESFRSLVSPFIRIWRKGSLDPDRPFSSQRSEAEADSIKRLMDLFGKLSQVHEHLKKIDSLKNEKSLLNKTIKAKLLPGITKTKYQENLNTIRLADSQLERLKEGFSSTLSTYEELFDKELIELQGRRSELISKRSGLTSKIGRLRRELSGISTKLSINIRLIAEFFPNVNSGRIEEIENFHFKIGGILKKELSQELGLNEASMRSINQSIDEIDKDIQAALQLKGTSRDIFDKAFELKSQADIATVENQYYERKEGISKAHGEAVTLLADTQVFILNEIESRINRKLANFNRVVYGPDRDTPALHFKSPKSYEFISQADTGTGKSFASLVGFDVVLLVLTALPFFVHDSVVYKNIEIEAMKRIIRIFSRITRKQIFISIDEAPKFGLRTQTLLEQSAVLKLSKSNLLYRKDWRISGTAK